MKTILDTNIWRKLAKNEISESELSKTDSQITATFINIDEIAKSRLVLSDIESAQQTIRRIMKIPALIIFENPIIHLSKLDNPSLKFDTKKENELFLKLTEGIAKGYEISKKNYENYINEREQELQGFCDTFNKEAELIRKNIKGLRRPPQNGFWRTQLKIRAYYIANDDSNANHSAARRFIGLGSAIKIYNPQNSSDKIYSTTIHELAHASHWNLDRSAYNNIEKQKIGGKKRSRLAESWARGVQWELTRMVYPNYKGAVTILPWYTQVVVDMIDPNYSSESTSSKFNYGRWDDNVTGYTIVQIEDALKGQRTWNGWKNNIKNKYNNGTRSNLEALFNYWN